jgi:PDZ domain-containing protein
MRIKFWKQLLWVVNALLVLGVVGIVAKFFLLGGARPAQARTGEEILGEVIQQGRRKIERDKPDPPHTYRNTHELEINGTPPPPPEVIGPSDGPIQVSPLARNYELLWTKLDPQGWGSMAHLERTSDKTIESVEVGEKVDRAWKLIRVGIKDAEFEDETSGNTVTLERRMMASVTFPTGMDAAGTPGGPGSGNIGGTGVPLTPEEEFKRGPIKAAIRKGENHWEMPREEADWWERHGEQAAAQVALQPETDPETGRPAGVRVLKMEQGSILGARGLQQGDRIISINGTPVNSRQEAIAFVKGPGKGAARYIGVVERKGKLITLTYDVRR